MVKIVRNEVLSSDIEQLQAEYPGYIKIVVDINRMILAAGGEYHVDCEQVLLADGSKQSHLWGGGYTVDTKQVDYFAMSNYRPADGRVTYEIADPAIRQKFDAIVYQFFPKP